MTRLIVQWPTVAEPYFLIDGSQGPLSYAAAHLVSHACGHESARQLVPFAVGPRGEPQLKIYLAGRPGVPGDDEEVEDCREAVLENEVMQTICRVHGFNDYDDYAG